MTLDLSGLIPIYKKNIDAVVNEMGKSVRLYYRKPQNLPSTAFEDQIRNDQRQPSWKDPDNATEEFETEDIIALIKWNPKELAQKGIVVQNPEATVRLKTFITHLPKLQRAEFIVPNWDVENVIGGRWQLMSPPMPVGLKEDRYCVAFFERVQ